MPIREPQQRSEYNRSYREENREALRQNRRKYYLDHKADISAKAKLYRRSLPRDIVLARRARSYEKHKVRESRRYHATRAWLPWLNSFRGAKNRAKVVGIPFDLTKEWAEARWTGRCEITGIEFVLNKARKPFHLSPSLDRIIPSLGYTKDNCRFILHAVNALKGAGTDVEMFMVAEAIIRRNFPLLFNN